MLLRLDCRHFPGDRPCRPHKEHGVKCDDCSYFSRAGERLLIIKLDAVGDVLRTTAILPGLKERYPESHITWVTMKESLPIFLHNQFVDRVIAYDSTECTVSLGVQYFDLVINLDAAPKSASLASYARATTKLGFGVDEAGKILCFNPEAEHWLEMGAFDDIKKQNTRTYQDLMFEVCKMHPSDREIVLTLSDEERRMAGEFCRANGIPDGKTVIGLNTGASGRWEQKKWTLEGYRELIRKIVEHTDFAVILYGGALEHERNTELRAVSPERVVIADTRHSLREFFALMSISDLVITGDTLALHVATALKKRVLAIFGPTSAAEIESYGRVRKIVSDAVECKCYYRPVCDQDTNCMNTIPPDRVFAIMKEELARGGTH